MEINTKISQASPLISVIMCSYNEDSLLEEAIESVLNQSFNDFELIISDDASPNKNTLRVLEKYKDNQKIKIYLNDKNLGYLNNKNYAFSLASGEYLTQLDCDDLYSKDKLLKQIEIINKNPEIKIVGCGYKRIDQNGKTILDQPTGDSHLIPKIQIPYPFWFPSLLVKREVYENIGYFNPFFNGALGDDIYWTVIANKKYPIYHIGDPMYYYRHNVNSITNVLNNDRKIIIPILLDELIRQNIKGEVDWLAKKEFDQISKFESDLRNNRKFMSGQYQIWAAKAVDNNNFPFAQKLLTKSFLLYPLNFKVLKTLLYLLRKRS